MALHESCLSNQKYLNNTHVLFLQMSTWLTLMVTPPNTPVFILDGDRKYYKDACLQESPKENTSSV